MIKIMFDNTKYSNKPDINEVKKLQNRLQQTEMEIKNLANNLAQGCTFKPAYLNGRKSNDFMSQQLFALDFDNNSDVETELNRCKELNIIPCFGYTTFSHTELKNKFRLVFCNDEIITDIDERNKLQKSLILAFDNCDKQTMDASRIFFGGRELICKNYNSVIKGSEVVAKYYNKKEIKNKPNTSNQINTNTNMNIEAIKNMNVNVLTQLIDLRKGVRNKELNKPSLYSTPKTPLVFSCQQDLYDFINNIDISEYLGLTIGENFNCILPKHQDNNPSARIFISDDGTPLYYCHGCGKTRTIISITEELARCKRSESIEFIKCIYNLELKESEWTIRQKQLMLDSANYLDSDEFKMNFPYLSSLIRTRKPHIKSILLHFTNYINESITHNDKPLFYASYKTLMNVCGINPNKPNTLSQSLTLFALLNMIEKVSLEDIPENELKKAKHISAKYNFKKLTNFYSFSEYGILQLEDSEELAQELKDKNVTLKGISREYILRTFGEEKANKVYPQYIQANANGVSKISELRTEEIVKYIIFFISNQGYTTEKDVIKMYSKEQNVKEDTVKTQLKRSIQEILEGNDLIRVRANKQLKEYFRISSNGYPFLILKNEDYIKFVEGCEK